MIFRAMRALSVRMLLIAAFLTGVPFACTSKEGGAGQGRTSEDCANACWRISAANCGDVGQDCVDRCVRERIPAQERCAAQAVSYRDCYWQTPGYVCDVRLGTYPTDCDAEFVALTHCLAADRPDATPDAAALDAAPLDAGHDAADAAARDAAGDH